MHNLYMLNSTEQILNSPLRDHIIHDRDLALLFQGTPARRYALVNKMLKAKELVRLSRGTYMLASRYRSHSFSLFQVANQLISSSYISSESALSYHGWIPERVAQITSTCAYSRSKTVDSPLGQFVYLNAPINLEHFYKGVECVEHQEYSVLIASPLRALIDYLYSHRIKHASLDYLINSLRIEVDYLEQVSRKNIEALLPVYRVQYINTFLTQLLNER